MKADTVLITGTTSGIGRALLEHYARTGAQLISVNRRNSAELEAEFPRVRFECVDVRSTDAVERLIFNLAESAQLPHTFILNAGINRVDNDESFQLTPYAEVLDTNLYGVLNFVQPLTRLAVTSASCGRTFRHVIAMSSMANYVGNPYCLGYHTSKRALTTCFDVWSEMYAGTDLVFQQVMLGPVPTAIYTMADALPAWMTQLRDAFSGSQEGAVRAISRFARTRKAKLFYPWKAVPLYVGARLGQSLVPALRGRRTLNGKARRVKGD